MKQIKSVVLGIAVLLTGILSIQAEDKAGFRFPGGNAESGSELFVVLNCVQCHSVKGVHFEELENRKFDLSLGEEVRFVKKYEDIVMAISNPRHVIKKQYEAFLTKAEIEEIIPFMEDFTERITVSQFMDLVTFLDKAYANANESYGKK